MASIPVLPERISSPRRHEPVQPDHHRPRIDAGIAVPHRMAFRSCGLVVGRAVGCLDRRKWHGRDHPVEAAPSPVVHGHARRKCLGPVGFADAGLFQEPFGGPQCPRGDVGVHLGRGPGLLGRGVHWPAFRRSGHGCGGLAWSVGGDVSPRGSRGVVSVAFRPAHFRPHGGVSLGRGGHSPAGRGGFRRPSGLRRLGHGLLRKGGRDRRVDGGLGFDVWRDLEFPVPTRPGHVDVGGCHCPINGGVGPPLDMGTA